MKTIKPTNARKSTRNTSKLRLLAVKTGLKLESLLCLSHKEIAISIMDTVEGGFKFPNLPISQKENIDVAKAAMLTEITAFEGMSKKLKKEIQKDHLHLEKCLAKDLYSIHYFSKPDLTPAYLSYLDQKFPGVMGVYKAGDLDEQEAMLIAYEEQKNTPFKS